MSIPEAVWNAAWQRNWKDDEGTIHRILNARAQTYRLYFGCPRLDGLWRANASRFDSTESPLVS
jgi:hypothetical protein